MTTERITAALRPDQWDLIIIAMQRVRALTNDSPLTYAVDYIGRQFLRRCIDEIVRDIEGQVKPKGEEGKR